MGVRAFSSIKIRGRFLLHFVVVPCVEAAVGSSTSKCLLDGQSWG